jgi:histone-arginine methyltransferase CARM1
MRTSTYQSAMLLNTVDFTNKVIIDVGAGSGILSFFAVQAGAKRVYAVEASSMAVHCQMLVKANKHSNKIVVIAGKVEEVR